MRKFRLFFFSLYAAFHLGLLGFSLYAEYLYTSNNLKDLLKLSKSIPHTRWLALLGIILFLINLMMFFWGLSRKTRRIKFLEQERNEYKAKMYGLDEDQATPSVDNATEQ